MPFDHALMLIDVLRLQGIYDLDIMGGEPFLLKWMPDFIRTVNAAGILANISTNGSMPQALGLLAGMSSENLNIGVSLEGSSAERHNRLTRSTNFEKAVRSITMLVSMGLDPIVKTVVNRSTMDDILNIVHLLRDIGVRRYFLIHMDLFSKDPAARQDALSFINFMAFYRRITAQNPGFEINKVNASCFDMHALPSGTRCAGGVRKLSIMPDGSVYPCNLFQHFREFNLGNIFSDNFMAVWNSSKLDFFRSFERNRCAITNCSNHPSCTGGCPAHGYFHAKDLNSTDIRCLSSS